jgi:putative ABC transport system permease protein
VVLTVTLGIGANSAIFSVIDAVLLTPLPYPDGDRLMALYETSLRQKVAESELAPVKLEEWNRMNSSFTGITGAYTESLAETSGTLPEKLVRARVAPRFFEVLGAPLLAGRAFTAEEESINGPNAAVISERLWTGRFHRDPQAVGAVLRSGNARFTIVGIAPDSIRFPADDVDVWTPAKIAEVVMRMRDARFYSAIGRLKPGATEAGARADLIAVQGRLALSYPATDGNWSAILVPLKEQTVAGVRKSLWILFGAVTLVLLIACTNVACLLLAQGSRREREIAVRFSLGAARARVIRELLTEALCAALPGAVLGLGVAVYGTRWFRAAAAGLPRGSEIRLDWHIVAFTFVVTIATAILFGLFPALSATSSHAETLAQGSRTQVSGRNRVLRSLVSTQIALALVLLVGAGLLIRTLERLGESQLGFRPDNVLTLRISAGWGEKNNMRAVERRFARTLDTLRAVPGATAAAISVAMPGTGEEYPTVFTIAGAASSGVKTFADSQAISPDYFQVMGIPILAGETCRLSGAEKAPDYALVNRAFAEQYFPGMDPIGQHLKLGYGQPEIVGVTADVREHGYAKPPRPVIYSCGLPGFVPDPVYLVKTAGAPAQLSESVRKTMQALEPARAVYDARPLTDVLALTLDSRRFQRTLLVLFGIAALLLATVGLYGVMSFYVSQRTREMGLRAALGARPEQILRLVFRQGASVTGAGIATGLIAAAVVTRSIGSLLFGVQPIDPATFTLAAALLAGVAALAVWIPARRATQIDPMAALREE